MNSSTRRFRFSLRTLFVVVTVAAAVAWYSRPRGITIIGDISRADVATICEAVAKSTAGEQFPILSITLLSPGHVEVTTGRVKGPLSGGGRILTLDQKNGTWIVTGVSYWVA